MFELSTLILTVKHFKQCTPGKGSTSTQLPEYWCSTACMFWYLCHLVLLVGRTHTVQYYPRWCWSKIKRRTALQLNNLFMLGCFGQLAVLRVHTCSLCTWQQCLEFTTSLDFCFLRVPQPPFVHNSIKCWFIIIWQLVTFFCAHTWCGFKKKTRPHI